MTGAVPMEALMAAQMQQQMPPSPPGEIRRFAPETDAYPPDTRMPSRSISPEMMPEKFNFPTAKNTLESDEFRAPQDPAPFGGKGSYVLPKKTEKKKGKR
jgi:hypothetical protein